jgi:EAL domain-containing protein (putative c-di-GMP-specific phosphodiesterase class I)
VETAETRTLRAHLCDAIDNLQFEPFFQPQFRLSDRRLTGFEVLVRWRHPERGLLQPGEFLPTAAAAGLMDAIDNCVLQAAIEIVGSWVEAGLCFGRVAVNFSQQTFSRPDCVANIKRLLDRHAVPPKLLSIEVVESILMGDAHGGVASTLAALRALDINVELDDFGTGYASLSHLRIFKVDRLKLDRSFVAGIGLDKESEAIVRAVVMLAQSCEIACIAEGIETEAQMAFLQGVGCDHVQGFLLGRPCSAEDARRIIEAAGPVAAANTLWGSAPGAGLWGSAPAAGSGMPA